MRQQGRNGGRQCASRAVRGRRLDPLAFKNPLAGRGLEHIRDDIAADMPALHQRAIGAEFQQGFGGAALAADCFDRFPCQDFRLRCIRRHKPCIRDEFRPDGRDGLGIYQAVARGRDHDRVDDTRHELRAFRQ